MRCCLFFHHSCAWHRAEVGNPHQWGQRQQKLHHPQALNTASVEEGTLTTSWVRSHCHSAAAAPDWDFRLKWPRTQTWALPQRREGREGGGRSLHSCCRSWEGLTQEPENWSIRGLSPLTPMGCKWAPEWIKGFSSWSCSSGTFHQKGANFTVLSK